MPDEGRAAALGPEPFDPALFRSRILDHFHRDWIGNRLEVHREIASTNDRIRQLLDTLGPAAHGAVVVADGQTSGRGRHGHTWLTSPGKALALSVALWFEGKGENLSLVPLAGGLAVLRTLREFCGIHTLLKWPNDVLCSGKKIAGVLVEGRWKGGESNGAALGIGVNLHQKAEDFPPELRSAATSVLLESGNSVNRGAFVGALLGSLQDLLSGAVPDPQRILAEAEGLWIHQPWDHITFRTGNEHVEGRFEGIGPRGELILRDGEGLRTFTSGEVEGVSTAGGGPHPGRC